MNSLFAFLGLEGPWHWIVLAELIGILLFGRRLPELCRALGKRIVEFKKGLHGPDNRGDGD